jgi:hypothetical protein
MHMLKLPIALSVCSLPLVNGQQSSQAVFSSPNINGSPKVITPEFSEFVEQIVNTANIHGLSLAVVRKNGDAEFGAWGNRTEEGDAMTSSVRYKHPFQKYEI